MNARELADLIERGIPYECGNGETSVLIIRALRLLAAAEGGEGTPETDALDAELGVTDNRAWDVRHYRLLARHLERERTGLAARVGELEPDAERYRWLREGKVTRPPLSVVQASDEYGGDIALHGECLDAAIDAARSK